MTTHRPLPQVGRVRELLSYDPETGVLTWRVSRGPAAGTVAGNPNVRGYVPVMVDGTQFRAHRLAWLLATGDDPGPSEIDHRDGDRSNNRMDNLRLASRVENTRNRKPTGRYLKGVERTPSGRYRAKIYVNHHIHLGMFDTEEEAHAAYVAAAHHHFGEFANVG